MAIANKNDGEYAAVCQVFTGTAYFLNVSTANAVTSLLPAGRYRVTTNVDILVKQGASTIKACADLNAGISHPIWASTYDYITVTDATDGYLGAVTLGGTGIMVVSPQR